MRMFLVDPEFASLYDSLPSKVRIVMCNYAFTGKELGNAHRVVELHGEERAAREIQDYFEFTKIEKQATYEREELAA